MVFDCKEICERVMLYIFLMDGSFGFLSMGLVYVDYDVEWSKVYIV